MFSRLNNRLEVVGQKKTDKSGLTPLPDIFIINKRNYEKTLTTSFKFCITF